MRPRTRFGQRGQTAAEYIAVLALLGIVVLLVASGDSGIGRLVRGGTAELICHVLHAGCRPAP
jgi:hypothetical protein